MAKGGGNSRIASAFRSRAMNLPNSGRSGTSPFSTFVNNVGHKLRSDGHEGLAQRVFSSQNAGSLSTRRRNFAALADEMAATGSFR